MSNDTARNMTGRIRGGFTIVELLIVTAMIILLLSILVVAVNRASRTSQITNTRALMNAIGQSLERFKEDVGYYPPVFGLDSTPPERLRALFPPPDPGSLVYASEIQDWWSSAAIAEYLIGYDEGRYDGYGYAGAGEVPALGIRDPGPDAVWGATLAGGGGTLQERDPPTDGKVYGPYLELKDERLLGSTDGSMDPSSGNPRVFFPGDGNYNPNHPKIIVDYWGNPIRYYRTVYKPGAIKYPFRAAGLGDFTPTLADVFVLRPWEVKSGAATDSPIADFGAQGDTTATYALKTAAFALFSAGPDRSLDWMARFDVDDADGDGISGENEDNIVEVGP